MPEMVIHDPELTALMEKAEADKNRREFNRKVKMFGGSWRCRGGCGRMISANKLVCKSCSEKETQA